MRDLFNTDKPLFAVLTKLTYSAYLNILWLVCSLPIVTIGASTTAFCRRFPLLRWVSVSIFN